jgi:hypothetical protein
MLHSMLRGLLLILLIGLPLNYSQAQDKLTWETLEDKSTRMNDYAKDFHSISRANIANDGEFNNSVTVEAEAGHLADSLRSASSIVRIYSLLSCEEDRARVKPLLNEELRHCGQLIDYGVQHAEIAIAHAQSAGLATTARRFREELREIEALLRTQY